MLHVLTAMLAQNEKVRGMLLRLRPGPYAQEMPQEIQRWLDSTEWGPIYTALIHATRSKFKLGFIPPGDRHALAKRMSTEFRVISSGPHELHESELVAKCLRLLDQITDDLATQSSLQRRLSLTDIANILRAYWFHHAVIAVYTALWELSSDGRHLVFRPTERYLAGLRQASLATWADDESVMCFLLQLYDSIRRIDSNGGTQWVQSIGPGLLADFSAEALDRFYFINPRFLRAQREGTWTPLSDSALDVMKWIVFSVIDRRWAPSIKPSVLTALQLNTDVLREMISHTRNNASPNDKGIHLDGERVTSKDIDIRHLVALYAGLVIREADVNSNTSVPSGGARDMGMWFEQCYAKAYVQQIRAHSNYVVIDGFKSSKPDLKYDVDFLILDRTRAKLFLIQIKYHRRYRYYRWGDEISDLFSDGSARSGILCGYKQLDGVRNAIGSRTVQDQILNCFRKSGDRISRKQLSGMDAHYVVLHTVTSLDFASVDGSVSQA